MSFQDKVLHIVRQIPRGKVTTYGLIAQRLESSPRAVGQALKRNKHPIVIPCHRVIKSDRTLGGYSGKASKEKLLRDEGVKLKNSKVQKESIIDVHTRN